MRAPSVFISYRREDTADLSGLLARDIKDDLGLSNVFRDTDDLRPGLEFPVEIERRVVESNVTIALIGSSWAGSGGTDRLQDPEDWVRREISLTFESGNDVIPVLVDGAELPSSLPSDIARLSRIQSLQFDSSNYADAYQELLASVWYLTVRSESAREVIIISDDTTEARLAVDELVETLDAEDTAGARALSRVAVGLRAVSVGEAAKRWPDVIILTDGAPSEKQLQRLKGIASHKRIRQIGYAAAAGVVGAGGVAVGHGSFARAQSIAERAGDVVSSVSFDSSQAVASWMRPNPLMNWWQGLGTLGNVGVVAGALGAVAVAVTLASSDPEPAPRAPVGDVVASTVTPATAPPTSTRPPATSVATTVIQPADEQEPEGFGAVFETAVVPAEEACTLTLEGVNGEPDPGDPVTVEVGETLTVCGAEFFPFDVPVVVTGPDGTAWDPATLVLTDGSASVQPYEAGGGWEAVAFGLLPDTPLGTYRVFADVGQDAKNEAARAATAAAAAGETPDVSGGGNALALVEVVAADAPRIAVSPVAGPPGTEFTIGLVGFEPAGESTIYIYAHAGTTADDPPIDTWQQVASLSVVTGGQGEAMLPHATLPEDPAGRYLLVVSEEQHVEYVLEE